MTEAAAAQTLGEAVASAAQRLAAAGIEAPRREARLLIALALGIDPALVLGYPERLLDPAAAAKAAALVARRATREPYSRLAGRRQFWSLDFSLSPETLDPRPDSETLIEAALAALPNRRAPLRIIDFGTGSGCLLLALLSELPNAIGLGIDILPGAAATARRNAAALGLGGRSLFVVGNWGDSIGGPADVIVANPPYICSESISRLAPEVARYEPRVALDGGSDGLEAYRPLAGETHRLLRPGGAAFFELGEGQAPAVSGVMAAVGLAPAGVRRDLAGVERVLLVKRQQNERGR
jgi:release factor glutamine methyltransferase